MIDTVEHSIGRINTLLGNVQPDVTQVVPGELRAYNAGHYAVSEPRC